MGPVEYEAYTLNTVAYMRTHARARVHTHRVESFHTKREFLSQKRAVVLLANEIHEPELPDNSFEKIRLHMALKGVMFGIDEDLGCLSSSAT